MNAPRGIELALEAFDDKDLSDCGSSVDMGTEVLVKEVRMDKGLWLLDLVADVGEGNNDGVRVRIKPSEQPADGTGFEIRLNQIGTNR